MGDVAQARAHAVGSYQHRIDPRESTMANAAGTLTRSGTFVWEELVTSDVAGAREFYGSVLGWSFDEMPMGEGMTYTMAGPGEQTVGGIFQAADIPPHWGTYVGVDSADAATAKAVELGATVIKDPFDVMDNGRMAVIQDPTGAVIQVWQALGDEGTEPTPAHGTVAWREVRTVDIEAAVTFYSEWLGWKAVANDMGDFVYYVFHKDEVPVAGAMQLFGEMSEVPPHWSVTFNVDDVDATFAKATANGAKEQMAPDDISGVGRFAALEDPQGVSLGIMKWA